MLPSIDRPRINTNRDHCASNLRQIGQAATLYALDHQGQLPPDFATLLQTEDITSEVFVCPSSTVTKATGATTQQVVASLRAGGHSSYAWVGAGLTSNASADIVLAFDLTMQSGINVLLGDGHVVFVNEAIAKAIWAQYHAGVRPIRLSTCTASAATTTAASPAR